MPPETRVGALSGHPILRILATVFLVPVILAPDSAGAQQTHADLSLVEEHRFPLRTLIGRPGDSYPDPGWNPGSDSFRTAGQELARDPSPGPGPGTSFLASLAVPGSAQWMHGQDRTWLYMGVELVGWLGFFHGRHRGDDFRDQYRDVAWTYARLDTGGEGFRGGFGFYETLGHWTASGMWDSDPTRDGVQPETDPDTYNGDIWSLASDLYLSGEGAESDPEAMQLALLYYRERAYPPDQAWDWSGNSAQLERYRDLIERSDDSFRRATVILGAVVANHLLSAVDGFLSTRISSDRAVRLSASARPYGRSRAMRWNFELSLNPFP